MSRALHLAEQLISRSSVTPDDAGCQSLIAERLGALGFDCEPMAFGPAGNTVSNLWALRRGNREACRMIVFAGHTDVVPPGPLDQWHSEPFVPNHRNGYLYGRGAADMKSSLAAMVVAAEEFVEAYPTHEHSIAFLLTSDEEGPAVDGTVKVCEWLSARSVRPDFCVIGEATSVHQLGDMMKNGRRGSLSGRLTIKGVQGHIAYPHLARNPIHQAAPALAELAGMVWDHGNAYFPATSWQMSNIHSGTGATNVIPGDATIDFNFRFCTESTPQSLKDRVHAVLDRHELTYDLTWNLGGEPFLTPAGELSSKLGEAILAQTGMRAELSTSGGTSDGRFIAKICPQVIEFGPVNASVHKIDECIEVASIEPLKNTYRHTLELLLT